MSSRTEDRNCPVCGAPATIAHRPFCSRRCADVDLSRWFRGRYVIPGRSDEEIRTERENAPKEADAGQRGHGNDG